MDIADWLAHASRYSRWLSHQLNHQTLDMSRLLHWLPRSLDTADLVEFADWQSCQEHGDEQELARQLRLLRRHVMAHIMIRDLNRVSDLAEVTQTITMLADFAVNQASAFAEHYYRQLYGTPIGAFSGVEQHLSVIAMGKAGGFELNVSSDLDLIFVFAESGETNGRRSKSNQEFFTKVGQKIIALLDEITADGQVFRIDMRLRPDGDSGALVLSETALEQYLIKQGREWERYAWCKARVVTPYANDIQGLVRPFVFRKYLDFHAYDAMRALHGRIRHEVQKQGRQHNIKLGAGGIREIEFIAQIFQMIRGGQNRVLQLKGTQETLLKLAQLGLLDNETSMRLLATYRFLREVEHRLQYWDDQQTQMLPEQSEQQQLLAESMGFADYPAFLNVLTAHREYVNHIFNDILGKQENETPNHLLLLNGWLNLEDEYSAIEILQHLGFRQPESMSQRLYHLKNSSKYQHLSAQAQPRFDALIPIVLEAASQCHQPDITLSRLLELLENISRRSAYLAFLQEYPQAMTQVAQLMSQSSWLADYLQRHPILLDELLSAQLMERLDWQALNHELAHHLVACDDVESKMDVLRHFQHAQTFRLAVQDLAGLWSVEALSDELSLLADTVLQHTLQQAWLSIPKIHQPKPQFAIIGYGRLGGKELGYTSDLDLVYLYQDDHPEAAELYSKLARRLGTWLSGSTAAGTLYDLDLRLRPNGDSGFLVHSLTAFEQYQQQQAWTWEHQALTRARYICGDTQVGQAFERIRCEILTQKRDIHLLKHDIIAMREKMFQTHPPIENDVKYARGGVVDVEFIVQYLVLSQSCHAPSLLNNYGNIALLKQAAELGLIDITAANASQQAYRYFRSLQHNKKLRDLTRSEVDETLLAHYAAVKSLWQQVFSEYI